MEERIMEHHLAGSLNFPLKLGNRHFAFEDVPLYHSVLLMLPLIF